MGTKGHLKLTSKGYPTVGGVGAMPCWATPNLNLDLHLEVQENRLTDESVEETNLYYSFKRE